MMYNTNSVAGEQVRGRCLSHFPADTHSLLDKDIQMLTQETLKQHLHYDPDTGDFRWLVKLTPKTEIGAIAGNLQSKRYWQIRVAGKSYQAHRLAWFYMTGAWPKDEIDHINCNKLDNRFRNLREATHAENQRNKGIGIRNSSGCKGVSFCKRNKKWVAQIKLNGKATYLGLFPTIREASDAYTIAAKEKFGAFFQQDKQVKT